jgi:hypothetical protein
MSMLLMIYDNRHEYAGGYFGENCAPILLKLAEGRDITIAFKNCFMRFDEPFRICVLPLNKTVTTGRELLKAEFECERLELLRTFSVLPKAGTGKRPLSEAGLLASDLPRRPQMVITGDSVTAEQAARIRKWLSQAEGDFYIDCDWCHEDGSIYYFQNCPVKYPTVGELYENWKRTASAFPFLSVNVTLMDRETWDLDKEPAVSYTVRAGRAYLADPQFKNVHEDHMDRIAWMTAREYGHAC